MIGGGMVGTTSALRLQTAGFGVTLIDPGDKRRGASYGNAGHIAAEQPEPWSSPRMLASFPARLFAFGGALDFRGPDIGFWLPWSIRFVRASSQAKFESGTNALGTLLDDVLPAWQRLAADAGQPSLVRASGHCVLWMSERRAARGIALWRKSKTGRTSFREMEKTELADVGNVTGHAPAGGIRFTGTGQFSDPQGVRDNLSQTFLSRGGRIVDGRVESISADPDGIGVRLESGGTLRAARILIAAGAWSRTLMARLGVTAPLIGERGYSVQSARHSWPEHFPPMMFDERSIIVTRFTSGLRATSFLEFGRPDSPADPRKWESLERDLKALGVPFLDKPDRWMGPRPTLPDYLPAIGRLERDPRILYAFGHQHLGMTMSAITAEQIEALALGKKPAIDLAPFRVERFA